MSLARTNPEITDKEYHCSMCGRHLPDWPDSDICPDCKEHTGVEEEEDEPVASTEGELFQAVKGIAESGLLHSVSPAKPRTMFELGDAILKQMEATNRQLEYIAHILETTHKEV